MNSEIILKRESDFAEYYAGVEFLQAGAAPLPDEIRQATAVARKSLCDFGGAAPPQTYNKADRRKK